MNKKPLLTVVILTYNRKEEVLFSLDFISRNSFYDNYELIVVDNNSSDNTFEEVSKKFPNFSVMRLNKNLGLVGWNEGIKKAKGKYFLLLDDDSHPEYGVEKAVEYMEDKDDVGIIACNIVGGPFKIENVKDKEEVIGFINCGVIIKRDVVEKVGYFKEWMFMFANEWEYSIRVKNAGYRIVFLKDCVVRHRASPKNRSYKFLRIYTTRNELATVWMYFSGFKKFVILFRVLFWNSYMFRKEGINSIFYTFYGFFKFLSLVRILKRERNYVKPEILLEYEMKFWSFKPILPLVFKKFNKFLKYKF